MAGILVFAEVAEGKLARSGFELLGGARKLADDLGVSLAACLLGDGVSDLAQELIYCGADYVLVCEQPLLSKCQIDLYLAVMEQFCRLEEPSLVMFNGNAIGRQMAPRLAYRLKAAIATDCISIENSPGSGELLLHKPVYGGKATAVMVAGGVQVVTMRARVMEPLERDQGRKGEVKKVQVELTDKLVRAKVVERIIEQVAGIKLEDARIVISGGRGIGGSEGFEDLSNLANTLKGAVGASRAAVDSGWVPPTRQVGLTGKVIAPDLYIAIGISGASQHLAGMSGSKYVIAINKDSDAPIFNVAKYGLVEDYRKVLPLLIEKVKEVM